MYTRSHSDGAIVSGFGGKTATISCISVVCRWVAPRDPPCVRCEAIIVMIGRMIHDVVSRFRRFCPHWVVWGSIGCVDCLVRCLGGSHVVGSAKGAELVQNLLDRQIE